MLSIRGAVSMYELEGGEIARILFRHGDCDLTLAFHEIENTLFLRRTLLQIPSRYWKSRNTYHSIPASAPTSHNAETHQSKTILSQFLLG